MSKKIFIIGASSGIGLELVKIWLKNGYQLVVSSRNAKENLELKTLKDTYKNKIDLLNIDVTDNVSVKNCVDEAFNISKSYDICFYNAGIYEAMDIYNIDMKNFEEMININYLGAVRVLKNLIDNLKNNSKNTRIVLNGSLSSYFGLPYGGAYSGSKAALVNFAESIQPELKKENIDLQIINHGFVKTRLTNKNDFEMPQLMEAKQAAEKIFFYTNKAYRFEITFPFILTSFLRFISLLPYRLSFLISKKFLK